MPEREAAPLDREAAIDRMMQQHAAGLLRLCFVYLKDYHLAEEAMQDCFVKAWRGLDGLRQEGSELAWLSRIAINTCKDYRKAAWFRRRRQALSLDQLPEPAVPFEPWDDSLVREVMALPPRHKEVILLCYYQGLSPTQAAQVLRVSQGSVYARLRRAREALRTRLEGWDDA